MAGSQEPSRRLLARAHELRRIDDALRRAAAGTGAALLIEGQAGIGKTALLAHARTSARRLGVAPLCALGRELEEHFSYGVVRQLFQPAVLAQAPDGAPPITGVARRAADLVLDTGRAPLDPTGPQGSLFEYLHSLYWLTVQLSQRAPLLIVVDDLQLADSPSLRFLLHLVRRLDGVAAAVVGAVRTGDEGRAGELISELRAEPLVETVRPEPLQVGTVARIVAAGLGQSPDGAFAAVCHAATGGVPLLVHQLVGALRQERIDPTDENAGRVDRLGPAAVARDTLRRLRHLPEDSMALARAVAVLDGEATLPLVTALAGTSGPTTLQAVDALVGAGVLQLGERLEFVHPIVRAAIYDSLPAGERTSLHRRAAELLVAEGAELQVVAAQLLLTEPGGAHEVISQLRDAARQAMARGAAEDAGAYLSRALAEGCERAQRAELTLELATAARVAGQGSALEHYREAHRLADDPVVRGKAALGIFPVLVYAGQWEPAEALVRNALQDLRCRDEALTVRLERCLAGSAAFDPRAVEQFDRRLPTLLDLARRGGDEARPLAFLLAMVSALRGGDKLQVSELVERGWDGGRAAAEPDDWTLNQGIGALVVIDELARAGELAIAALAAARVRGSLHGHVSAGLYQGFIESRRGHLGAARVEILAALQPVVEQAASFGLASLLWFATDLIVERPDVSELAGLVENVDLGALAATYSGALLLEVRGRVRHAAGRTAEGADDLREAGRISLSLGFRNPNGSSWRSALASMLGGEDIDEARRLAEEELADALRVGLPRAIGVAHRTLGCLERGQVGREHLEQAVNVLDGSPAVLEHARALVELGAALRRGGEPKRARDPLRAGLDLAVACDAALLVERARVELTLSGARPRRLLSTGRDGLTPGERRVARLAAQGHTNNEVAQALFITPKTVDTHLSRTYAKLGISSRQQLAAALGTDDAWPEPLT